MSVLLNGAPLNGASSYTWAEGHSITESLGSVVFQRAAYTASTDHTAVALTTALPDRDAWMAFSSFAGQGNSNGIAIRNPLMEGLAIADVISLAKADRTAWMALTSSAALASTEGYFNRWRLMQGQGQVEATLDNDDELTRVLRITRVRDTRGVAQVNVSEFDITLKRVNQVQFTGSSIARARTIGLANTEIGFGTSLAEAVNATDNLWVNIARAATGISTGTATVAVSPYLTYIGNSIPAGDAHMYIAPDILRADGSNERHNWAIPVGETVFNQVAAVGIRTALLDEPEGICSIGITNTFYVKGARGRLSGVVNSAISAEGARVNRWQQARGVSHGRAAFLGDGARLAWVGAFGASNSMAGSTATAIRYRWKYSESLRLNGQATGNVVPFAVRAFTGTRAGTATSQGIPFKRVSVAAAVSGAATTGISASVYSWVWASLQASEGRAVSAKANGLRLVRGVPVRPIVSEAIIPKVYFRINADAFAPDRRTIFLRPKVREMVIPYSNREVIA